MNKQDILEALEDIRQANVNVEDLLNADLNCMDEWQFEIEAWNRACQLLNLVILEMKTTDSLSL